MSFCRGHLLATAAIALFLSSAVLCIEVEWAASLLAKSTTGQERRVNLRPRAGHALSLPLDEDSVLRLSIASEMAACGGEATGACIERKVGPRKEITYESAGDYGAQPHVELVQDKLGESIVMRTMHADGSSEKPTVKVTIYCMQGMKGIFNPKLVRPKKGSDLPPVYEYTFYNQAACGFPVYASSGRCSNVMATDGAGTPRRFDLSELEALTSRTQSPLIAHHPLNANSFIFTICSNMSASPSLPEGAVFGIHGSSGKFINTHGFWPLDARSLAPRFDPTGMGSLKIELGSSGRYGLPVMLIIRCDPNAVFPSHIHAAGDLRLEHPTISITHRSGCPL